MSTQAASKFLEKMSSDETLCGTLLNKNGSKQERFDALVEAGRERGFTFDGHDVESLVATARRDEDGALDERDLEQVAGGMSGFRKFMGSVYSWLGAGGAGDNGGGGGGGIRG